MRKKATRVKQCSKDAIQNFISKFIFSIEKRKPRKKIIRIRGGGGILMPAEASKKDNNNLYSIIIYK